MPLDPLTITAGVAKLVTSLADAAIGCGKLVGKYRGAPLLLSSIQVECKILRSALNHVYAKVNRDPKRLEPQLATKPLLVEDFDIAIDGCTLTFALLHAELQKLLGLDSDDRPIDWKDRCRYIWNEDAMTTILEHMRGLRDVVHFLLDMLQA